MKTYTATLNTFKDIEIREDELPRAIWNYIKGLDGVYSGGAGVIKSIVPDKIQSMGWNKGHKPSPEEWGMIKKELGYKMESDIETIKRLVEKESNFPLFLKSVDDTLKLPEIKSVIGRNDYKQIGAY